MTVREIVGDEVNIRGKCGVDELYVRQGLVLGSGLSNLSVAGSLEGGSLTVTGSSYLNNADVTGNLDVGGEADIGGNLNIGGTLSMGNTVYFKPFIRQYSEGGTVGWNTIGSYGLWNLTTFVGLDWSTAFDGTVGIVNSSGHFEARVTGLVKIEMDAYIKADDGAGNTLSFMVYEEAGNPANRIFYKGIYSDITTTVTDDNYFHAKFSGYMNIVTGKQYLIYTQSITSPNKTVQVRRDLGMTLSISMV